MNRGKQIVKQKLVCLVRPRRARNKETSIDVDPRDDGKAIIPAIRREFLRGGSRAPRSSSLFFPPSSIRGAADVLLRSRRRCRLLRR